jgi:SNF2 family DNA or RNA helicase
MTTKAFAHQNVSIKHNDSSALVLDVSDPGTGKTFVRIAGFAKRRKKGGGCMLVLAPRSLLRSVWVNDIKKFAPLLTTSVADAANREKAFAADADVYITNVDAVKWLVKQKPAFFKKFSELVIDESTAYKHHTSQRSKAVAKIAKHFKNRCCMTGTPNSNSITDIWHQVQILDEGKRLGFSFYKFRDAVCTPTQVGRMAQAVRWDDKEGAEEAVFGLLSDIVVRHKFEDCVDIPPNHQYPLEYELTSTQMRAYLELQDTQMLMLKGKTPAVLAINAAAVATKLLQVASGAVYDGTGGYRVIDTARYEMILDLVEQRKHSLCFFLWKHQRDALVAEAEKRGITFAVIDGSTSDRDRDEIVQGYQAGVYRTIFAHPKSAAHGLTLTKGTATIWSSPTYDLEIFKQGSKRQHRMGQTQKTETIVVIAKDTIEQKVYDLMLGKDARMTNLLDLFGTLTPKNTPAPAIAVRKKKVAETV